ncbi:MAG: hypothetical protein SFV23_24715 [Planctomycetaceae bacterium]|nr:hypothetical protein [Planctomycetaceae bacterium]
MSIVALEPVGGSFVRRLISRLVHLNIAALPTETIEQIDDRFVQKTYRFEIAVGQSTPHGRHVDEILISYGSSNTDERLMTIPAIVSVRSQVYADRDSLLAVLTSEQSERKWDVALHSMKSGHTWKIESIKSTESWIRTELVIPNSETARKPTYVGDITVTAAAPPLVANANGNVEMICVSDDGQSCEVVIPVSVMMIGRSTESGGA